MQIAAALVPLGVFWLSTPAPAEVVKRSSVVVTMPRLALLQVTGDVSGLLSLSPDGSGEAAYEAGAVESDHDATILTVTVTEAWDLLARIAGPWTCPGTYDKDENDLQVRITNTPVGTIQNGADNYVSLTGSDLSILSSGFGCVLNVVDLQTKIALDWTRDVPGTYSISMTYTVVGHLP